nr:immunoglobulin heavy chain junction region [Macaca mulatta]MOW94091.1 immunoglobulin heavy chain junction region [Macaca mulatta]MOW94243.1 immunoglobulin heavy chain junction region [Macaca mulatta]MOW97498.1 immunoglobulin heavy chain junction region [Macaca mulatta]
CARDRGGAWSFVGLDSW